MKHSIPIILLFLTFSMVSAQNFAPIGAEWYYGEGWAFDFFHSYLKITSIKD